MTCAGPRCSRFSSPARRARSAREIERVARQRQRRHRLEPVDHLDLVAVGVAKAHALAAARLVEVLDPRGAFDAGDLGEVVLARGMKCHADIAGLAQLGDVQMVRGIGAAHEQRLGRARGPDHPEIGQELLREVEIGRPQPPPGDVGDFDRSGMDSLDTAVSGDPGTERPRSRAVRASPNGMTPGSPRTRVPLGLA